MQPLTATMHSESETLFWTKAASMLGLPQNQMENSEVPMSAQRAEQSLRSFLRQNGLPDDMPLKSESDFFAAFSALVKRLPGHFVEKTPHHLYQPSCIALMERYANQSQSAGIHCHFIGLVRNPIDTLYSSWRRFGVRPSREAKHWLTAYRELRALSERSEDVHIIRYEDLVSGRADLSHLTSIEPRENEGERFVSSSVQKWRSDPKFSYQLSDECRELALDYGYDEEELSNDNCRPWPITNEIRAGAWQCFSRLPFAWQSRAKQVAKRFL